MGTTEAGPRADSSSARVLVVEDESAIRDAVEHALSDAGYDVVVCADGLAATRLVQDDIPDIAVFDINLGDGPDGFAVARALREHGDVPFLFLTAADDLDTRLRGFGSGCDDYMVKPFAVSELLARIDAILRRSGFGVSDVLTVADVHIDRGARRVVRGNEVELTFTEFELLHVLARHEGRVCSKRQLLLDVWGSGYYDTNIVEGCVSALRRKLEAHGTRVIHTVRGVGYVMRS